MNDMAQTASSVATGPEKRGRMDPKSLGRLIIGVVFLLGAVGYLMMAFNMPTGKLDSPGPGMFPVGVGVVSIIVGIIVVLEALTGGSPAGNVDIPTGFERRQSMYFLATFIGFVLVLPILGQYIASTIYVVLTLRLLGGLSWVRALIVGVAMGVGVSALFGELLNVSLPRGIW